MGITHILNTAQGNLSSQVDTNQEYYNDINVKFYGFPLVDSERAQIEDYLKEGLEFMHKALEKENGKIYVHCAMGVSRSATFVLAYMIEFKKMSLEDAIKVAIGKRYIYPNRGFLKKLVMF